jgi:type VI secretion system protein ImpH
MKFRLRIGPLSIAEFREYPPDGALAAAIKNILMLYCGREFLCEVNPVLLKDEIPNCRLGQDSRLGFSTWLQSRPATADATDYRIPIVQ